jgi:hypothetical protein
MRKIQIQVLKNLTFFYFLILQIFVHFELIKQNFK